MPNPKKPSSIVLNSKSTRILNLAAVSLLLLLAEDVYLLKIVAEVNTVTYSSSKKLASNSALEDSKDNSNKKSIVEEDNKKGKSNFKDSNNKLNYRPLKLTKKRKKIVKSSYAKKYCKFFIA
jgi:hypothetical protein